MSEFKFVLTKEIIDQAIWFENFRNDCKEYLKSTGNDHDKFTVVSHDSYIGFISELYIKQYIDYKFGDKGFSTSSWSDKFDLEKISDIVKHKDYSKESSDLVNSYFYDPYDLEITNGDLRVFVDVKTALTAKSPSSTWDFMYPVVQANKKGKDYMILVYFITENGKADGPLKQIDLIGFTDEKLIKKCKIIWKGMYTKFHTKSQINNYETNLSRDYKPLRELFDDYEKYFHK